MTNCLVESNTIQLGFSVKGWLLLQEAVERKNWEKKFLKERKVRKSPEPDVRVKWGNEHINR